MLRISWGNSVGLDTMSPTNGYGYATERIVESLRRLGYHVEYMDARADVHIHFDQPQHFEKPRRDIFSIMYHPWESTLLPPKWVPIMNSCDEVWTPSPLIADWYTKYAGITRPVYVFEHGVDKVWQPVRREFDGQFKFLHVGGEALRKGMREALEARRLAFGRNPDVSMTFKTISSGWAVHLPGTRILNKRTSFSEMLELFNSHHAYVYPSYGEGFGLTPLQAIATGMPTITTGPWAPYRRFLEKSIEIPCHLAESPWPVLHPGHMLHPDVGGMVEAMRYTVDNYESLHEKALDRTTAIFEHYDWDRLTETAFSDLSNRLK